MSDQLGTNSNLPQFHLRTLLIVVGVCAVVSYLARLVFVVPNLEAEDHIRQAPIQTRVEPGIQGSVVTRRVTYCVGQYGVSEFGNIRLAIRGLTFSSESSSGLLLSSDYKRGGGGSSTGVGNRRFTTTETGGGSINTFGDVSFTVIKCILAICGKQFAVDGPPRLIIIDEHGKFEADLPIGEDR